MGESAAAPSAWHSLLASRNVEIARSFLAERNLRLGIAASDVASFDARLTGAYLRCAASRGYTSCLNLASYGATTTLDARERRDDYWIQLPLRGEAELVTGAERVACSPSWGGISSPSQRGRQSVRMRAASVALRAYVTRGTVTRYAEALLGEPLARPVEFAPALDLSGGHGRWFLRQMLCAMADLQDPGSAMQNPAVLRSFEQHLVTSLLLSQPSNLRDARGPGEPSIAPRDIRRALDFIEANLGAPIGILDIARAAGVPGRTLFAHFRAFTGLSPLAYLREARLRRVRSALLHAGAGASVTAIATAVGFEHLGRFSQVYRRRYGELPSVTLARRR